MICINFKLDLDQFLSSGHLHTETILVTTEYISGTSILVYQKVGEKTTQAFSSALYTLALKVKTGLRSEYFFHKKTYGTDKLKSISKSSFLERIGTLRHDEKEISQETLLKYRYDDKQGRDNSINIIINRNKNSTPTARIDFADMNEYVNFCPPDWLRAFVEET